MSGNCELFLILAPDIEQLKQGQVLYVDGGWQTLVSRLTDQAHQAGVSIRTISPAREIAGSYPE
jgi:hypothetical protein